MSHTQRVSDVTDKFDMSSVLSLEASNARERRPVAHLRLQRLVAVAEFDVLLDEELENVLGTVHALDHGTLNRS